MSGEEEYQPLSSVQEARDPYCSQSHYSSRKPLPTPPLSPVDMSAETFPQKNPITDVPRRKPVNRTSGAPGVLDLPQIPPRPSQWRTSSFDGAQALPESLPTPDFDSMRLNEHATVTLTLIRRDPTSGAQWNVAKIYDPPVEEVSSESYADARTYRAKRSGVPLFVDISNPGYSKFLHDHSRPVSRHSTESAFIESDGQANGIFRRRLWMDGSKFADHSYTHRKHMSVDKALRSSLRLDPQDYHISPRAVVDRRSKGYSFRSPWGGKCEFATGVSGRALKVSISFAHDTRQELTNF